MDARHPVWVVDDSPLETQSICSALASTCRVSIFADGATALEALSQRPPPDVLVLDWEMPGLTGIEVCGHLRCAPETQTLPILLLTSHHSPEDVAEGLAAGANDYVFKPFRPVELAARVNALARLNQLRRQAERVSQEAQARNRRQLSDEQARRVLAEGALTEAQDAEARAWRSEQRFQLAVRATRDLIWEWHSLTGIVELSGTSHPLLEGSAAPDMAPLDWWMEQAVHPEDRARVSAGFEAAVRAAGEEWQDAYRFRKPDGTWADVVNRAFIVRDRQGRAVRVVGALQDVTAQKRLEAEARQQTEFERQLIGIVSHDLRNPLAAITITAASLRRQAAEERQHRGLMRISLSADRASRMISDLLDFTQARHGVGLRVHPKPANLHELARGVVEEAQAANPERRIEVDQTGEGSGEWDAGRLAQVISNLVGNALQYGPPDMPVRVTTRGEDGAVMLEVHNTGTPIAPDLLPRIFEPLERGSELVSQSGRSIGLGLYIVRHIVQAHGGTVSVASTEAEGTTFTVRLARSLPAVALAPLSA